MSIWNEVAGGYGKVGPNYWAWFGERLVEHSMISSGQHVLDIACGRGASLLPAYRIIKDTGKAIGLDTSDKMIGYLEEDLSLMGIHDVELYSCELNKLKIQEGSLDHVLCGFGLGVVLNEMPVIQKILKDDGVMTISVWTYQEDQAWMTKLINKHLDLEEGPVDMTYCTEKGVKEKLKQAGFSRVRALTLKKYFEFRNAKEWWQDLNNTAVKIFINQMHLNGTIDVFKKEAFEHINRYEKQGKIMLKREAMLFNCRK